MCNRARSKTNLQTEVVQPCRCFDHQSILTNFRTRETSIYLDKAFYTIWLFARASSCPFQIGRRFQLFLQCELKSWRALDWISEINSLQMAPSCWAWEQQTASWWCYGPPASSPAWELKRLHKALGDTYVDWCQRGSVAYIDKPKLWLPRTSVEFLIYKCEPEITRKSVLQGMRL
jgi:hypothetical protein